MDKFMTGADPLFQFVKSEIDKKRKLTRMMERISEQVLGLGIIGLITALGFWALEKIKQDFHIK